MTSKELIMLLLVFMLGIMCNNAFINFNKCIKKLDVCIYFCELKMHPFNDEFYKNVKKIKAYNKLINIKKEIIINDPDTKNAVVHGLLDSTSDDIFYQIADILLLVTNTNKEALMLLQTIFKEYFKYNVNEKLNKEFRIPVDTRNIIVILFRNIVIPELIHDLFRSIFSLINQK